MGTTAIYSFGEDSPIKLELSDKVAELYNQAAEKWYKANVRFNQKFGRPWDPDSNPIKVGWTRRQKRAWDEVSKLFDRVVREEGPFHENDIMEDYLVRNTVEKVVAGAVLAGMAIGWAAIGGAVWESLRRS